MIASARLSPEIERLLHSVESLTGHEAAFHSDGTTADSANRWEVASRRGARYGVLTVSAAAPLSENEMGFYGQLARTIAYELDLRVDKNSLEERFRRLDQHTSQLADLNQALSDAAYHDSLTGLYRRWYLSEQVRLELVRAGRHRRPLSIVLFDIDRIASANRALGAIQGDAMLRSFAALLRSTCRTSDVLARTGGDEFCVLLPDTSAAGAMDLTSRIQSRMLAELANNDPSVSVSAGGTTYEGAGDRRETTESFMEIAYQRLNRAKRIGFGTAIVA